MAKSSKGKSKGKTSGDEPEIEKVVCRNRRALHDYEILETFEAGMALSGTEVKSLRGGKGSLEEAFGRVRNGELWLLRAEIPEYTMGNIFNHEPKRPRKLLIHRREIAKLSKSGEEKGLTLVPLRMYFRRGWVKVQMAIARGKRLHDKRETLKKRDASREMAREMRRR